MELDFSVVYAAPTYTQIPNIFLDEQINELSLVEIRVLMFIFRRTLGWHKVKDQISICQIEKATKCNRKNVSVAVKSLESRGLIKKIVAGSRGQELTIYELNMANSNNCDRWQKTTGSKDLKKEIPLSKPRIQKSLTSGNLPPTKESSKEMSSPQPPMGERAELPKRESLSFEEHDPEAQAYARGSLKALRDRGIKIYDEDAFLRKQAAKWVKPSAEPTQRKSWPVKNNSTKQQEIIKEVKDLCRIAGVYCSESRDDLLVGFDGIEYSAFKCQEALFEKVFNNCIRMLYEKISRAT